MTTQAIDLQWVIDHIAESVIVSVLFLKDGHTTVWGCGICQGEYQGTDKPDGRGVYAHKRWCPRR